MEKINNRFKWSEATGEAKFIADRQYDNLLHGRFYRSTSPRAIIKNITLPTLPDGYYIFGADDIPGQNALPIVELDWPAFAENEVFHVGQVIFLVVGEEPNVIDQILQQISVEYIEKTPIYSIEESENLIGGAIQGESNIFDTHTINRGDIDQGFELAETIIEEECTTGYQEHIYLETQGVVGFYQQGKVVIEGSMQCPWYVHHCMAVVLGHDNVRAIQTPTGGGFGGKEDYPDVLAAPVAVAVNKLKRPVRVILDRQEDIAFSSKRHPSRFRYRTGLDKNNKIIAMEVNLAVNSGAFFSLSGIVIQRAITTATNVYDIPNVRVTGTAYRTNTVPTGAFRGFGSPQTCFSMETHIGHLAKQVGIDTLAFKKSHLLRPDSISLTGAPMHQELVLDKMLARAEELSDYYKKLETYGKCGDDSNKGIGLAVFQHGCGFAGDLEETLVKARVRLLKLEDDTLHIHASNTDIGQGLTLTFRKIVAEVLNKPLDDVTIYLPDTGIVPDSGPTVASRSILIVGYLLEKAAKKLQKQWVSGQHQEIEEVYQKPEYHQWDQETFTGNAYQATSYGVNVVEVEVDPMTAEIDIKKAWALYDVGKVIDEQVFRGQIDGGLVQALGYGSCEKMELDRKTGMFAQRTMADYVIPTILDVPSIESEQIENLYPYGPLGAKGGGELTHNGGAAALTAAVECAVNRSISSIPVTPEYLMEVLNED
ncbi:xanthine dehydrogenase family protein molybdopterin-binding subunit [Vibrio sp. SS-MA-C1-2]|uniref:xanthine dehydrogenase family protein molybdopterin-binding subunit n=1 Tax=Vibrio sp. SS-MA-C1-2 TaxID=2908646 RepID=UPI001F266FB0|nr:xanthine dehydrogenase family protein molybdopterin-binding subunit [Vibrio sp. SS-MA-C1-2]UJF18336.1 xanthine dehydrogenase family protein molybdopterin-binding subunit [Vibrio sp. SS-MA-C1-2]